MVRKTKDEAQKTRTDIMAAAERLFYERGVVRTSLQEVATHAGVTRGAIYWHFQDKVALLRSIADRDFVPLESLLDRLAEQEWEDPLVPFCRECITSMNMIANNPRIRRVFTILTQRCEYIDEMMGLMKRNLDCRNKAYERFLQIFEQAYKKGILSSAWSPQSAAIALQYMIVGMLHLEMEEEHPSRRRDQDRKLAIESFFKALSA
ncbi:MAG: TetR family transcriptional regulator [Proteobacteria bacterium]|jgi:AcrR family transcriptional regulator|nr:TetR family transcriptional regulator [Pseudomonadota bacterium]